MDLEQLLSKLENDELKDAVVGLISAEKERGVAAYRKKDSELVNFKGTLKSKGYDPETMKLDEWLDKIPKTEEKIRESNMTIAQLNDKLNHFQSQLESERTAVKQSKIQAELTNAVGNTFYGSEYMIKSWLTDGKVDLVDGQVTYEGKNFREAFETIKNENKGLLRVNQAPGSGDNGGFESKKTEEASFAEQLKLAMRK